MKRLLIVFVLCLVEIGMPMFTSAEVETVKAPAPGALERLAKPKKLIEWGWDCPTPAYLRKNIQEMEKRPFDGVVFWLRPYCNAVKNDVGGCIFSGKKWDEAGFAQIFEDCRNIQWQKFTDNFVGMYAASAPSWDWFSDADWETASHNLSIITKAAVLARCRGIKFDFECNDGKVPWAYSRQVHAKEKSFAEYEAKARQRGAEFVRAISTQMPKIVIQTTFQLSYFQGIMDEPDPGKRSRKLSQHPYSLLPAFLNGMLDAAGPEFVICDGNEDSYYYEKSEDYYRSYHMMRRRALSLIAPENVHKYRTQVKVSQALASPYVFGEWPSPGKAMTQEERATWFEHNVYYALSTSDEFVWLYSQRINWWKNDRLPAGIIESIESARKKLEGGKGFSPKATADAFTQARTKLTHRSAAVARLSSPPVIDGKLDDHAWEKATPLDEFVPLLSKDTKIDIGTKVFLGYDDKNLYVAFRCEEPNPDKMRIGGGERDGNIWGDVVEIFLAQGSGSAPFVHLALNPRNVQWDALCPEHVIMCYPNMKTDFDPKWQSAVVIGDKAWTVELALPWAELEIPAPQPGSKLGANFCRTRTADKVNTTWSQNFGWFCEDENFGTLEFK